MTTPTLAQRPAGLGTTAAFEDLVASHERAVKRRHSRLRTFPWIPATILAVMLVCAIGAPMLAPYQPDEFNLREGFRPPVWVSGGTWDHALGTDRTGRDEFSRLLYGSRIALLVASIAITFSLVVGVTLGMVAGFAGGIIDHIIMRFVDGMLALPSLLFAMLLAAIVGPGLRTVIIVISAFSWMQYARLVRGLVLSLKQRDYVQLAKVAGASQLQIMLRHMLPNTLNIIVILATLEIGSVITFEASLSFLGFGVQPPTPTWGAMLSEGRNFMVDAWWLALLPGLAITFVIMSGNLFGDWLRDITDPRLRQG
jgi:peptide/nickel transport system permease protein